MTLIHPFTSVEESRTSNVNKLLDGDGVGHGRRGEEDERQQIAKFRADFDVPLSFLRHHLVLLISSRPVSTIKGLSRSPPPLPHLRCSAQLSAFHAQREYVPECSIPPVLPPFPVQPPRPHSFGLGVASSHWPPEATGERVRRSSQRMRKSSLGEEIQRR